MDIDDNEDAQASAYRWESGMARSWESVREDESGLIVIPESGDLAISRRYVRLCPRISVHTQIP